jgi:hypothetical protein
MKVIETISTIGKWTFDIVEGPTPRVHDGFFSDWPVVWPSGEVVYDRPERIPAAVKRKVQSWFNGNGGTSWRVKWTDSHKRT